MSQLLETLAPYDSRDDVQFLSEMNALTCFHLSGCEEYRRIWPDFDKANAIHEIPYLHVGLFKNIALKTNADGIEHQRTLRSSATSSGIASQIVLDKTSSDLQSASTLAILKDFVGERVRPLLILDSSRSLRARGGVSTRIAAALSLRPLASELHFLLNEAEDPQSLRWAVLRDVLQSNDELLVYGFTWILWLAWAAAEMPDDVRQLLAGKRIHFVHSGGWKKLEEDSVTAEVFDNALLTGLHPESRVVDFYGLVEQVGLIYPRCESGFRHVPAWADVLVRDSWSFESLEGETGQLQLMNTLARGAPYHNVLTEDLGRIVPGECACGRKGKRFELLKRVPKAEIRGCANV